MGLETPKAPLSAVEGNEIPSIFPVKLGIGLGGLGGANANTGADILGSAIAALFENGVELAALPFDDVDVIDVRLNEIRSLADDAMILVAALAVLMRRTSDERGSL